MVGGRGGLVVSRYYGKVRGCVMLFVRVAREVKALFLIGVAD